MLNLSQVAQILQSKFLGPDASINGVSTDTRTLKPGQLYLALRGDQFDGHDFVLMAEKAGAVAAVVSHEVQCSIPLLKVINTRRALVDLARYHRQQFTIPFVAITGSCGKTTTKALLSNIFSQCGSVLSNPHSFNNDIGVPLTLLQLASHHQFAVTEMGANHPGEIAFLTHLVHPQVAIITNAAAAHLEGFGDIEGVACAKGEIFQGLVPSGIAVINADDAHLSFWRQLASSHQVITFGINHPADVSARQIHYSNSGRPYFELLVGRQSCMVELQLMGEHNVSNALAAAAAAYACQVPLASIQAGLNLATAEKQRLVEQTSPEGALIIDDSYNANPFSMYAAIQLLARRGGERVLIMGDMCELGENALHYHQQVGLEAKNHGIEQIYCFGDLTRHTAQAFGKHAYFFSDQKSLIQAVRSCLHEGMTLLIKGSRSMGMDKVVTALQGKTL